jgi:hypothetical protein
MKSTQTTFPEPSIAVALDARTAPDNVAQVSAIARDVAFRLGHDNDPNTFSAEDRPHAERSASQLGPLVLCAGYVPSKGGKTHWVTAQGNRGHDALDTGDSIELESDFEERMVALCELYASKFTPAGATVVNEFKVTTISGRWGFGDRLIILPRNAAGKVRAIYMDWKFVRSKEVTDAEINLQGKDYVVGVLESPDPRFVEIDEIEVHFVMPRFGSASFTREPFTRADVPALKLEIFSVLAKARKTDTKRYRGGSLTPNYDVCKYCGMAGNCVALRKIADGIARKYDPIGYGQQLAIPDETHASLVKDSRARAQLQELAGLMEVFAKSVRHHNLSAAMLDDKHLPEGYAIDYTKAKREVSSVAGLLLACSEFGITTDDLLDNATLAFGEVEEILKDRAPRGQKGRVVLDFNQRMLELGAVERGEPTAKLARIRPGTV